MYYVSNNKYRGVFKGEGGWNRAFTLLLKLREEEGRMKNKTK